MPKILTETKHFRVMQGIRERIRDMPQGSKVPTVSELSKGLDLSYGTVVYALSRLAQEGLIYRPIGKQRYLVAHGGGQATISVAAIRPDFPSSTVDFLFQNLLNYAKPKGWSFTTKLCSGMDRLDFSQIAANHDAIMMLPTTEPFPEHLLKALRVNRKPMLLFQQHLENANVSSIVTDDHSVGRLAAQYMWELGYRQMLIVLDQAIDSTIQARRDGWVEYLRDAGLSDKNIGIMNAQVHPFDDAKMVTARSFSDYMDAHHTEATAVFCTTVSGAMAVLYVLREKGIRVPEDISVIAYLGESNMGQFLYPALTSIEIDIAEFCRVSVDLLDRQLNDNNAPRQIVSIKPRLVIRNSAAALKE